MIHTRSSLPALPLLSALHPTMQRCPLAAQNINVPCSGTTCSGNGCGCHRGYCWTRCAMGWCYTTRGRSQDFRYITCRSHNECQAGWNCAGSCTA
jgi:hypothetical protein